jgi:hypothetical protein
MPMLRIVLLVGFGLILPQVVGFAATRLGRRLPASVWPLAAAGTVAVYWAIFAVVDYRDAQRAHAAGQFGCGTDAMVMPLLAALLLGAHGALGSFLSMLDRRARRLFGAAEGAGRDAPPPAHS